MSGHSKWATTKHKKAVIDSRRAKNFAKLIKAIEVASRNGGPDVDGIKENICLTLSRPRTLDQRSSDARVNPPSTLGERMLQRANLAALPRDGEHHLFPQFRLRPLLLYRVPPPKARE